MKSPLAIIFLFFRFSFPLLAEVEPNDDCTTANPILLGSPMTGNFERQYDRDYFTFHATQPGIYFADVLLPDSTMEINTTIIDWKDCHFGINLKMHPVSSLLKRFIFFICDTGQYYLELTTNYQTINLNNYTFTVNLVIADPMECNNTFETASSIPLNTLVTGYIFGVSSFSGYVGYFDPDYYKIFIPAKGKLNIDLPTVPHDSDFVLQVKLFDSLQTFITQDCICGNTSLTEYLQTIICEPGTYYVLVTASHNQTSLDPYKLIVKFTPDPTECNEDIDHSFPIEQSQIISGFLNGSNASTKTRDVDWYSFYLLNPGVFDMNIQNPESYYQYGIAIYNPAKQKLFDTDYYGSAGLATSKDYTLCDTGIYYMSLQDKTLYPCYEQNKFRKYELQLHNLFPDVHECNNTYTTATRISGHDTIHAAFASINDIDIYVLHLDQYDTLYLNIDSIPDRISCNEAILNHSQIKLQNQSFWNSANIQFLCNSVSGDFYIRLSNFGYDLSYESYRMIVDKKSIITSVNNQNSGFIGLVSNICSDKLTIYNKQNSNLNTVYYSIVSPLGEILQAKQKLSVNQTININDLSNGIYTLILFEHNQRFIYKFIKI